MDNSAVIHPLAPIFSRDMISLYSVLSGEISTKLATDIQHANDYC